MWGKTKDLIRKSDNKHNRLSLKNKNQFLKSKKSTSEFANFGDNCLDSQTSYSRVQESMSKT